MNELRVELLMLLERARRDSDIAGWCLVTIDDESAKIVNVQGLWKDELSAIAEGQRQKNDAESTLLPGEKGWSYFVVPYFITS